VSDLQSLYLRLPVFLQHAAVSLEGWHIQRTRYGGQFPALLREAESRTYWSPEQIQALRDRRLRAFIQHAASTVPFYRRRFQELGIAPDDIRTLEDLSRLPILTRQEVQSYHAEMASEAVPKAEQVDMHTGGTTGGGLHFTTTRRAIQEQWSCWWRYRRWHGIQLDTWCGFFGGRTVVPLTQARPPFWRYNLPARQILFSAYHAIPRYLGFYIGELRRRRPPWLHGYSSIIAPLAAYILETGVDLGYQVRWITIGAEALLPQQAEVIERAFGVRPRQHYGMAEAVANISECELGGLHVDEDLAAVEFIPNPDGPSYRIIGTNFTNPATPLVRYDVMDLATLPAGSCPCGRPGRLVTSLDGRQNDTIVLQNGQRVGPLLTYIFQDLLSVREAQIHQPRIGEIEIRIVRGSSYTAEDEAFILREAGKVVGPDTTIRIEYVDSLPRSASGKLRFVVSDVPSDLLWEVGR